MPLLYLRFYLGSLAVLFSFHLGGHYFLGFPFPTPGTLLQIALGTAFGMGLGILYHRLWPLPPPGMGRVVRLFVLLPPAFMFGIGLLILLQAQVALPYLVPLIAWLTPAYGSQEPTPPKHPS
ncbi:hypothetical protein CSW23_12360 [Thermus scotoductus]|uniref:Uncharacterized protein n=1 Tax=Thermus scotoductus TaxID=37636 RepID=A0A430R2F6_THESC|nr:MULTISPECIES: hypothetical protein [Thermus]RTG97966.1 hypothetical protein CSW48_00990 [Thermus scotoductus]RTH01565.1 hypothetical protein CSW50_09170 [Thermus scotoductus]RTH05993.1 hypothetical protein CSW46_13540 [Thermus scotoductus]RTH07657.1 hypothetical protein CSW47_01415 [Thermus scotoductus]RTH08659.1 hypothetical protein CSW44_11165 [Thermus scotoductus]